MIESAFFFAFLGGPLLLGTAELGYVSYYSIEVANAAHAGVMFGMTGGTEASNTTGIATAAQAEAADLGTSLSVSSSPYWVCSSGEGGTQYTSQSAAKSACTSSTPLEFLSVTASATITPPVRLPLLPSSYAMTRTSVMEVQE